jgi:hypothetical protein
VERHEAHQRLLRLARLRSRVRPAAALTRDFAANQIWREFVTKFSYLIARTQHLALHDILYRT